MGTFSKPVLLIDFGSTYTKVTAVDVTSRVLIGTAQSPTTVSTDINDGLNTALKLLQQGIGRLDLGARYACSSASGGLKMVVSGLVPELTAQAARMAALGAGAKVSRVFAHEMTDDDIRTIEQLKPDIFLLTGGTDGGNRACIVHNAEMLAKSTVDCPIIIAGNRSASDDCARILSDRNVIRCPNVMPELNRLDIEPVQTQIRTLFLHHIIQAKGLTQAQGLIQNILMPTPSAVLQAMTLLAGGTASEPGIGPLVAVDVGGATTDVYSIASGEPATANTVYKGLPEPFAKRTVEGDIGMRSGLWGVLEAAGTGQVARISGLDEAKVTQMAHLFSADPDRLPDSPDEGAFDEAIASLAIETAVGRHAGMIEETYTPMGPLYVQTGKDLRPVRQLILTGGPLIHATHPAGIARFALWSQTRPMSLKPLEADVTIDRSYILSSMGVLSGTEPDVALSIMKKELSHV